MSTEFIYHRGQYHRLLPGMFYHLTDSSAPLLWNARLHEGLLPSISAIREGDFVTLYYILNSQPHKERVWEQIRAAEFPDLPTREKALFLFDDLNTANDAMTSWFHDQRRHLVEARIVSPSLVHKADAKWLDTDERKWESAARQYWAGEMTDVPIVEVIVCGHVYFPKWAEYPFGTLMSFS